MPTPTRSNINKAGLALVILSALLITATVSVIWKSTKQLVNLGPSPAMRAVYGESSAGGGFVAGIPAGIATSMPMKDGADLYYAREESIMPPIMPSPGASPDDRERVGQKIIRTGSLMLRVDDAAKQMEALKQLAERMGGFVSSANLTDNGGVKTAYATIRVPTDKYRATVDEAKKLATLVLSEQESGDDVTDQFVDLEARLKAARAEEAQYLEILKTARTIEDTLAVTERLASVRSRIEQMDGQMRYLDDKTSYATVSITMTEDTRIEAPTKTWDPGETVRLATRALIETLQGLIDALIAFGVFFIGLVLPILLVLAFGAWILLMVWKRFMK